MLNHCRGCSLLGWFSWLFTNYCWLIARNEVTMADAPKRAMKYPYTLTAQIMQFPYKHYWNHSWLFKYWIIGSIFVAPIFWKIQKLSYSEENQRIWNEKRKMEFEDRLFFAKKVERFLPFSRPHGAFRSRVFSVQRAS
ncbi:hypothetical protein KPH14_009094 [Odynerus spinipes]|uniref:Uncharacterized protein n=1 Tax=Odynerus spinipes TaxID=1348599 RepID=A0AAD9RNT1_9HYME|nr:hypothetical protein KPH14_009094 [Odynerus spinipes]